MSVSVSTTTRPEKKLIRFGYYMYAKHIDWIAPVDIWYQKHKTIYTGPATHTYTHTHAVLDN